MASNAENVSIWWRHHHENNVKKKITSVSPPQTPPLGVWPHPWITSDVCDLKWPHMLWPSRLILNSFWLGHCYYWVYPGSLLTKSDTYVLLRHFTNLQPHNRKLDVGMDSTFDRRHGSRAIEMPARFRAGLRKNYEYVSCGLDISLRVLMFYWPRLGSVTKTSGEFQLLSLFREK